MKLSYDETCKTRKRSKEQKVMSAFPSLLFLSLAVFAQVSCRNFGSGDGNTVGNVEVATNIISKELREFQVLDRANVLVLNRNSELLRINSERGGTGQVSQLKPPGKPVRFYFVNDHVGSVLDDKGQLLWTEDRGETWTKRGMVSVGGFDVSLSNQLFFLDQKVGWFVESFGVWRTDDGGYVWKKVLPNEGISLSSINAQPTRIVATSSQTAWVGMSNGKIYRTSDRGESWDDSSLNEKFDVRTLFVLDENKVWAGTTGGGLFQTVDRGETWRQESVQNVRPNWGIYSIQFIDKELGWSCGINAVSNLSNPESDTALLLKTSDGGKSWKKSETGSADSECNQIKFLDRNNGWLLGKESITRTEDGGNSWTVLYETQREKKKNEQNH